MKTELEKINHAELSILAARIDVYKKELARENSEKALAEGKLDKKSKGNKLVSFFTKLINIFKKQAAPQKEQISFLREDILTAVENLVKAEVLDLTELTAAEMGFNLREASVEKVVMYLGDEDYKTHINEVISATDRVIQKKYLNRVIDSLETYPKPLSNEQRELLKNKREALIKLISKED